MNAQCGPLPPQVIHLVLHAIDLALHLDLLLLKRRNLFNRLLLHRGHVLRVAMQLLLQFCVLFVGSLEMVYEVGIMLRRNPQMAPVRNAFVSSVASGFLSQKATACSAERRDARSAASKHKCANDSTCHATTNCCDNASNEESSAKMYAFAPTCISTCFNNASREESSAECHDARLRVLRVRVVPLPTVVLLVFRQGGTPQVGQHERLDKLCVRLRVFRRLQEHPDAIVERDVLVLAVVPTSHRRGKLVGQPRGTCLPEPGSRVDRRKGRTGRTRDASQDFLWPFKTDVAGPIMADSRDFWSATSCGSWGGRRKRPPEARGYGICR